jgi:transcriptional antiterminator RfaH
MPLSIESQFINDDYYLIDTVPERRWYPVYCKPNKEKKLAELASQKNISWYFPTFLHHRTTRGHCIESQIPMFPGYVFLQLNRQQNWQVKTSGLAIRILPVTEKTEPKLITDLNKIREFELLSRTQPVKVRTDLVPGKRFIITHGKLKGTEGVIVKRKNRTEFIVHLDFLGYSLATVPAMDIL